MSPAPDGLRFVQDLVNTSVESLAHDPAQDRLAGLGSARTWLRQALADWSEATGTPAPLITIRAGDLAALRELREGLRRGLRAGALNAPVGGEENTGEENSAADESAADESAADESAADESAADKNAGDESGADTGAALVSGGDLKLAVARDGRMRYRPASGDARAIAELVAAETLLAQARGSWPHLKTCANPVCGVCFFDTSPNRSRVWHDTRTCGNASNLRASRARRKTA
jgi:predicted RNA-binding Zn ribbon-like protein